MSTPDRLLLKTLAVDTMGIAAFFFAALLFLSITLPFIYKDLPTWPALIATPSTNGNTKPSKLLATAAPTNTSMPGARHPAVKRRSAARQ